MAAAGASGYAHGAVRAAVLSELRGEGASVGLLEALEPGVAPGGPDGLATTGSWSGAGGVCQETAASRWRRALNLGGWVRLVEPVHSGQPTPDAARVLVLHVDAVAAVQPTDLRPLAGHLAPIGRCLVAAYELAAGAAADRQSALMARVSVTQRSILRLLVTGLSESEIAKSIHRSPHTVHDHIRSIYTALGVSSRFELLQSWVGMERGAAEPAEMAGRMG